MTETQTAEVMASELPLLGPAEVARALARMLAPGAPWPPDEAESTHHAHMLRSLRAMTLINVLRVIESAADHLEEANRRHGLYYVTRDHSTMYVLDQGDDGGGPPPHGAEGAVLRALLSYALGPVTTRWAASKPPRDVTTATP